MYRFITEPGLVIKYLCSHAPEVFIDMMKKLLSDSSWSDNVEFIHLVANNGSSSFTDAYVGMLYPTGHGIDLKILSIPEFADVIKAVSRTMIRKDPTLQLQIKELCDNLQILLNKENS